MCPASSCCTSVESRQRHPTPCLCEGSARILLIFFIRGMYNIISSSVHLDQMEYRRYSGANAMGLRSMSTKRIPGLVISEADYELLRSFAHDQRINGVSEAVRHLIRLSPHLQAYAERKGLQVEFEVRQWGGARRGRKNG